ncbi:uncharacterized protein LOC133885686 [Phragmites australis]|uniref:uncharacterized protein LOC133885686 n=1 Tax=Phragmites australis TaxID=29695 RepID=UPI002D7A35C5|nr:uncharacterized protein LOC133885686 [Phragmites australis]
MAPPEGTHGTCSRGGGGEEPMQHERKLSSYSFSSPALSPSPSSASLSTIYLPASNKSSCESIPYVSPELVKQPSSSASSHESFFHIEAVDLGPSGPDHDCSKFLDFEPATQAPAVQTMMAQGQQAAGGGVSVSEPKRLPSSMFRTRSTSPAEWSVTSNDSLFSIQLSHSGDLGALYADLYYDAAGFPRFPSMGSDAALKLPSFSEASGGGLCVREDCARCSGSGKTRKSVRFAATESVSVEGKHSAVFPTIVDAREEAEAPGSATKEIGAAPGWCEFGCCWPSPPTVWWPRCCAWQCCDCRC